MEASSSVSSLAIAKSIALLCAIRISSSSEAGMSSSSRSTASDSLTLSWSYSCLRRRTNSFSSSRSPTLLNAVSRFVGRASPLISFLLCFSTGRALLGTNEYLPAKSGISSFSLDPGPGVEREEEVACCIAIRRSAEFVRAPFGPVMYRANASWI